jgi:hypothetical protein
MRPFSCGSQFADWETRNCYRCKKFNPDDINKSNCDLTLALGDAFLGDGEITDEVAKRIGAADSASYGWDCPERATL